MSQNFSASSKHKAWFWSFSESMNRLKNELTELYADKEKYIVFDRGINGIAVLTMADSADETAGYTREMVDNIEGILRRYGDLDHFIGVGGPVNRLSEIGHTYYEASRALAKRFFADDKTERVVYALSGQKTEGPGPDAEDRRDPADSRRCLAFYFYAAGK